MTFLISCFRLLLLYILTPDPDLAQQQQLDYAAIYAPCLLKFHYTVATIGFSLDSLICAMLSIL